ncbi:MAG TPA: hypothetical protein VHE56_11630 [Mycobacteriales bacterium]|nr:hypothetical protein [Mycobacteriales bacterium]
MAADLAAASAGQPPTALAWLLFVGSSVHVGATAGMFGFAEVRQHAATRKRRYLVAPLALVAGGAVLAAVTPSREVSVLLLGYFAWQLVHYQKQNLGLAALAAAAAGARSLTKIERRALSLTAAAGALELALRPHLLQLRLADPDGSWVGPARGLALVGYLGAVVAGLTAVLARTSGQRPASLVVLYLIGLAFPAPIFLFATPYATVGVLTIAHGLQYLLITGIVVGGPDRMSRPTRLAAFAGVALGLGLAFNHASHWHTGGSLARAGYGAYLGVVMTHFVVDGGLWRLRDPFPRRFVGSRLPWPLISTPARAA